MDFLDPICIVTPTGVECMSSPLKRHKRYGVSCVDEPPNPQMDALRAQLFSAIRSAVTNLSHSTAFEEFRNADSVAAEEVRRNLEARGELIARVAVLMGFCEVLTSKPEVPFNVFLAGHLSAKGALAASWTETLPGA